MNEPLESQGANPNTPPEQLTILGGHRNRWVRQAVASNQNTPLSVVETLTGDSDVEVRSAALHWLRFGDTNTRD